MTDLSRLTVAITGGAGRVATALRKVLSLGLGHVRVIDRTPPAELAGNESFVAADVTDLAQTSAAFAGVDGIIHLAGIPFERPLLDIVHSNVLGTSIVYEAARQAGVPRVVLGSSNHAMGMYPRDTVVGSADAMRPDGLYGLSKCWGELTAGLYYDKHGIRSLILRIGNANARPDSPRSLEIWVSPADLAQLCVIGLVHPDIDATTVYAVSKGGGNWWDNSVAERLGYVPRDAIRDFAVPSAFETTPEAPVDAHFQGGGFAAFDHDGIIRRR